jgi:hypothetical protein
VRISAHMGDNQPAPIGKSTSALKPRPRAVRSEGRPARLLNALGRLLRRAMANSPSCPFSDAQLARANDYYTHIANVRPADLTVANAVGPDTHNRRCRVPASLRCVGAPAQAIGSTEVKNGCCLSIRSPARRWTSNAALYSNAMLSRCRWTPQWTPGALPRQTG